MNLMNFKKRAAKNHEAFMKRLQSQIDKVFADHYLRIETCSSKITLICSVLKELDIITTYFVNNLGDNRIFTLRKEGISNCVQIYTNGVTIFINNDDLMIGNIMGLPFNKKYDVESKDFNWDKFADELLDKIHYIIYKQTEANEAKLDGIFQDPEKGNL